MCSKCFEGVSHVEGTLQDDDSSDDDEDDTADLLAELNKIKKERAQEQEERVTGTCLELADTLRQL